MKITSDFPGGNIKLISVETENGKTVVNVEQDLRDTDIWWFYWCFRVDDPPEGEVVFCFHNKEVVCPKGPATSEDGINWSWFEDSLIDNTRFNFNFTGEKSRYFSFSIPYVTADFERFYNKIESDRAVERSVLCTSEKGREIPLLKFGSGKKDIFFTARHHCCESTASYVLEGVIASLLNQYRDMLEKFTFHVIPFTDIDGVEQGDQGKNRIPHDHNRDYCDEPIYNYTKAIYKYTENRDIAAFIDFHSPWIWGGENDEPHIHFGPEEEPTPNLQEEFVKALNEITLADPRDVIKYNLITSHYGDAPNRIGTTNSKNFFKLQRKAGMAFTMENPYSGNLKHGYTVEQLRIFGSHIAKALAEILK